MLLQGVQTMKVADSMTREVRACTVHDSLNAAARVMWEHDCGCVPVVDVQGRLVGIVTDRDICMAAYTQGAPLEAISLERVMAARVISCSRTDDLDTAHRLMRKHEIHRLPVVDSRGRLTGILSLSDVVNQASQAGAASSEAVEIIATLSAIRKRRAAAATVVSESSNGDTPPMPKKPPKKTVTQRRKPSADRP
jgi:CBS domain-containing protein